MTVSLPPDVENYLQEKTDAGFCPSISEAIRDGVRLMKERDALHNIRLEALRAELAKAEASFERGDYTEFHSKEEMIAFFERKKTEGRKRLEAKHEAEAAWDSLLPAMPKPTSMKFGHTSENEASSKRSALWKQSKKDDDSSLPS